MFILIQSKDKNEWVGACKDTLLVRDLMVIIKDQKYPTTSLHFVRQKYMYNNSIHIDEPESKPWSDPRSFVYAQKCKLQPI